MNCPVPTWFQPVYCRRAGKPETNLSRHFQNSVAAKVTRLKLKSRKQKMESENSQSLLTSAATRRLLRFRIWLRLLRLFDHEHFDEFAARRDSKTRGHFIQTRCRSAIVGHLPYSCTPEGKRGQFILPFGPRTFQRCLLPSSCHYDRCCG